MISNPLKNLPWIVLYITPRALCHPRWISRQNHTVHQRVLNRTLDSDWMVPNKFQMRCDREAVNKSTVNLWFEKSFCDVQDFGKDCKWIKGKSHKENQYNVGYQNFDICVVSGTRRLTNHDKYLRGKLEQGNHVSWIFELIVLMKITW